jgi:hypothetical protein
MKTPVKHFKVWNCSRGVAHSHAGAEVGYYLGCVRMWRALQSLEQTSSRCPDTSVPQQRSEATTSAVGTLGLCQMVGHDGDSEVAGLRAHGAHPKPDNAALGLQRGGKGSFSSDGQFGRLIPSDKVERALAGLEQLLASFPLDDPQVSRSANGPGIVLPALVSHSSCGGCCVAHMSFHVPQVKVLNSVSRHLLGP